MDRLAGDLESLLTHDAFVRGIARRLVSDAATVDDVAQETWWAALRSHPASDPRPWLARIAQNFALKARRGARRQRDRETKAARPEAVPSTATFVEREAVRRRIVDAVLALPDPLRDAIMLRYFDGLPPRAIAKRTGEPVETVKSRLKRALAILRERLGPRGSEDRARFGSAFLALAQGPTPGPIVATATSLKVLVIGALIMTKSAKLVAGIAAIVLLVAGVSYFWRDLVPDDGGTSQRIVNFERAGDGAGADVKSSPTAGGIKSSPFSESSPVEGPATSPTTGSLLVRVRLADGTPGAGIGVTVGRLGWAWSDGVEVETTTDAEGVALFRDLPAGSTNASTDRGDGGPLVVIEAGKQTEHTIELKRGTEAAGIVVDEDGIPLADADVLLQYGMSRQGGRVVTRTAKDGTFRVRAIQCALGVSARASGYVPSDSYMLVTGAVRTDSDGARLILKRGGGSLRGRVIGPDEQPVSGAMVLVGAEGHTLLPADMGTGRDGFKTAAFTTRTDASGRFTFPALPTRVLPLAARARGFAVWQGSVTPAPAGDELVIKLNRGVTISGVVSAAESRSVEWTSVKIGDDWTFGAYQVTVDTNGGYLLNHAPPGEVHLTAEGKDGGRAKAVFNGAPDETIIWNPMLSDGLVIEGKVVDSEGRPRFGQVHCEREGQQFWVGQMWTDKDGRFRFTNVDDVPHRVVFEFHGMAPGTALVSASGVRPGTGEVVLVVPAGSHRTGSIKGRVVDAKGKPIAGAEVSPWNLDQLSAMIERADEDGQFYLSGLLPGRYKVDVRDKGWPYTSTAEHLLAAEETWDAGDIVLEVGGRVEVKVRRRDGGPIGAASISARRLDGRSYSQRLTFTGDVGTSGLLPPGSYELTGCSSEDKQPIRFELAGAETKTLSAVIDPAVTRTLEVKDEGAQISNLIHVLSTRQGLFFDEYVARKGSDPFTCTLTLHPGTYDVDITADSGRSAKVKIVVPDRAEPRATVPVVLPR